MGEEVRVNVQGMTCAVCVQTIEQNLIAAAGVSSVQVSLITSLALIRLAPGGALAPTDCAEMIEDMGFDAIVLPHLEPNEATITLAFAAPNATSTAIAAALDGMIGVIRSDIVDIDGGGTVGVGRSWRVALCYDRSLCGPRDLVAALEAAGAVGVEVAVVQTTADDGAARERRYWERLLSLGLVFTIPCFLIAMVLPHLAGSIKDGLATEISPRLSLKNLLLFLLATPVQFVLGSRFYVGAYNSLM